MRKRIFNYPLAVGAAFTGGFIAGWLATDGESRMKLRRCQKRMGRLCEEVGREAAMVRQTIRKRTSVLKEHLKKRAESPLPDLYKATEPLTLEDHELFGS